MPPLPCGQTLGSIFDANTKLQVGAITVVEQQDAWLLWLDESPVVADAYYAGFDATGGAVQGGYTVHHALSYNQQLTGWFGQAASVQRTGAALGTGYASSFWETVNQTGNIGPGASGSALFDQGDHVVGSLSLGQISGDPSGYGTCPAISPPAPNGSNGSADFTSLAAVWNSTADATSTTGSTTLQATLDPAHTGALVMGGTAGNTPLSFSASVPTQSVSQSTLLTWSAPGASSCTASGGVAGDNWNGRGAVPVSGTVPVTDANTGVVIYYLTCTFPGGQSSRAQATVTWVPQAPFATLNLFETVWAASPSKVQWSSNVSPCSLSGGSTALTNLPATGSTTVSEASEGTVTYTLSCGTGTRIATATGTVLFIAPALNFHANSTDRYLGSDFFLAWTTFATTCTSFGGAPGDGWANNQFGYRVSGFDPHVTTLGTYTYGLRCTAGSQSVSKTVVVRFEQDPPYVTLTSNLTTMTNLDLLTLTWISNVDACNGSRVGPGAFGPRGDGGFFGNSQGSLVVDLPVPGVYTLQMQCAAPGGPVESAPLTITVTDVPPTATLSASAPVITLGDPVTLQWASSHADYCQGSGGGANPAPWVANPSSGTLDPSGSVTFTPGALGAFTYTVTCSRSIGATLESTQAQATVTVNAAPAPPPATGGGGGGGGGAFDGLALGALGLSIGMRARRRVRSGVRGSSCRRQA